MDEKNNYWLHDSTGGGPIIAKYQLLPTCMLLASAHEFSGHFLQTFINGDKSDSKILNWLIQKKSGRTPIGVNICEILIHCIGATPSRDASRYHQQKNIANWCSKDRKILVTPSFFVVRPFLLLHCWCIYLFPHLNKMAIIGTLPSQFSDKNQQLYKGSLIRVCA